MKKISIGAKPQGRDHHPSPDQWVAARQASEPIKRLTIDITHTLHTRIKSQCAIRGVNMADEIRKLLEKEFPEEYQRRGGSSEPNSN
jgi:ParG